MLILGIDPGSVKCGYGIIENCNDSIKIIHYGLIKPKVSDSFFFLNKLKSIYDEIDSLLVEYQIGETAVESQFYSKNPQSLMKLTQAKTVVEIAVINRGIPVFEYTPREIKLSVTGRGNASKQSVKFMIENICATKLKDEVLDVSDALAVALCHIYRKEKIGIKRNSPRNWREFILMNPKRVLS